MKRDTVYWASFNTATAFLAIAVADSVGVLSVDSYVEAALTAIVVGVGMEAGKTVAMEVR
jgi:hypothetical protein